MLTCSDISYKKLWVLRNFNSFYSATTCANLGFVRLRELCSSSFKHFKTFALMPLGKSLVPRSLTFSSGTTCEGHATTGKYLSSLGPGHCHPSQASITTPIQSRTQLSMAIFPGGQYLSSLRLGYF